MKKITVSSIVGASEEVEPTPVFLKYEAVLTLLVLKSQVFDIGCFWDRRPLRSFSSWSLCSCESQTFRSKVFSPCCYFLLRCCQLAMQLNGSLLSWLPDPEVWLIWQHLWYANKKKILMCVMTKTIRKN